MYESWQRNGDSCEDLYVYTDRCCQDEKVLKQCWESLNNNSTTKKHKKTTIQPSNSLSSDFEEPQKIIYVTRKDDLTQQMSCVRRKINESIDPNKLIVGLDAEWKPRSKTIDVLQVQILDYPPLVIHLSKIAPNKSLPDSLVAFLTQEDVTWVGSCVKVFGCIRLYV